MDLQFKDGFNATQKSSSIIVNQTYSYINNTGFYALANPTYFQYYYRWARRFGWWYDRYVPDFHNAEQGYFSTGIAHAIVDGIANQIVGRKLLLKNTNKELDRKLANDSLKKAYKWIEEVNFTGRARTLTKFGGALGTSLLKTNVASDGELWLESLRFDDFFFKCDFRGELTDVVCLIKSYTDTMPRAVEWCDNLGENGNYQHYLQGKYYLVEHRYYREITEEVNGEVIKHRVPFVRYQVHTYHGNIINNQSWDMSLQDEIRWDSLPAPIRKAINKDYGGVLLGQELRLPFTDLGCDVFRYNEADASLSQQPFGQSILTDILSDLMNYELAFAYAVRDMYQGKGIVFMAKELQTAISGTNSYTGLDDTLVQYVQAWNEQGKLPIEQVQFNIRVAEWKEKRNGILEEIAFKLSISPSSLASFLSDTNARTAREVSTEAGATDSYIEIERDSLERCLNKCLARVGKYYAWEDEVAVRFAKNGVQNVDAIVDRVIKLKNAGLIEPYEALRQIMFDADESQVEEAYEKLKKYNDEEFNKNQNSMFGMDFNETEIGNNEQEV